MYQKMKPICTHSKTHTHVLRHYLSNVDYYHILTGVMVSKNKNDGQKNTRDMYKRVFWVYYNEIVDRRRPGIPVLGDQNSK